jgi:hypothetical protein
MSVDTRVQSTTRVRRLAPDDAHAVVRLDAAILDLPLDPQRAARRVEEARRIDDTPDEAQG